MKRLLTVALALALALGLTACGGKEQNDAPPLYGTDRVAAMAEAGAFSEELEELDADTAFILYKLADCGLEAIECFYPQHTPEQQEFYLSLARKYHLHVTGGSDFHGERVKPDVRLARLKLELDWLLG